MLEAGFPDANNDKYYGDDDPVVNPQGRVIGAPYSTPADADNNGTKDYLEVGNELNITGHPTSLNVLVGTNVNLWRWYCCKWNDYFQLANQYGWRRIVGRFIKRWGIFWCDHYYAIYYKCHHRHDKLFLWLYMRTPAFKCGDDKITNVAALTVFLPDFDNDQVQMKMI